MHEVTFYGTATVGTKGQIVIPAEAREKLHITPGDKMFIVGSGPDGKMLGLCTEEGVRGVMNVLSAKLETMRSAIAHEQTDK